MHALHQYSWKKLELAGTTDIYIYINQYSKISNSFQFHQVEVQEALTPWLPRHGSARRSRVRFGARMCAGRCCGIDHWVTRVSGVRIEHPILAPYFWRKSKTKHDKEHQMGMKWVWNGYGSSHWGYQGTQHFDPPSVRTSQWRHQADYALHMGTHPKNMFIIFCVILCQVGLLWWFSQRCVKTNCKDM